MFNLSDISVGRLLAALLVGLFAMVSVFIATLQAIPVRPQISRIERFRHAIYMGLACHGFVLSIFLIGGILNSKAEWSFETVGVLCLTVPMQIIVTLAYYIRLGIESAAIQYLSKEIRKSQSSKS